MYKIYICSVCWYLKFFFVAILLVHRVNWTLCNFFTDGSIYSINRKWLCWAALLTVPVTEIITPNDCMKVTNDSRHVTESSIVTVLSSRFLIRSEENGDMRPSAKPSSLLNFKFVTFSLFSSTICAHIWSMFTSSQPQTCFYASCSLPTQVMLRTTHFVLTALKWNIAASRSPYI